MIQDARARHPRRSALGLLIAAAIGLSSGACGPSDQGPAEQHEPVVSVTLASSAADDFIDRDHSADVLANASKIPAELSTALDEATKVAKVLSAVSSYVSVAVTALQMMDVLQSADDVQQARFDALHMHLNQLGVALSSQQLNIDRDQRLSDMRTYVNIIDAYAHRGGGRIDESLLSGSEIAELGAARTGSQMVAQNATSLSAFQWYYARYATDGAWRQYFNNDPPLDNGLAFDWRVGISEMVQLIATRLTIIGITDPSFRNDGERMGELGQYRSALQGYYQRMLDGIECYGDKWQPVTVICADVYTGLSVSTQFTEQSCLPGSYDPTTCAARIDPEMARMKRSLMTRMPFFEMRNMIDALSASMTTNPDLTANRRIRMRGTQTCLSQVQNIWNYDDPYNPVLVSDEWGLGTSGCASDVNQEWAYDRGSGHLTNAWGACLGQQSFELGANLIVKACSNSASERWSYDPTSGVLENAFHGVLSAPQAWNSPPPQTEPRDSSSTEFWESPAPICATANEYETLTLSCPAGQRIIDVPFASYGMPDGQCGSFIPNGNCDAASSLQTVGAACIGKQSCAIDVGNGTFGTDPCAGVVKRLYVQARCAEQPQPPTTCGTLQPGEGLFRGQQLTSCNGTFEWKLSNDGDLTLYQRQPFMSGWMETSFYGPYAVGSSLASRLIMQEDGNVVLYDMAGSPLWWSNTYGWLNSSLRLTDDGNLIVYSPGNQVLWEAFNVARVTPVSASQSTTAFGGTANRALDGNSNGWWSDNSVTHTDYEYRPWWQADLGSVVTVRSVDVYNRRDCCSDRLTNFNVLVSSDGVNWTTVNTPGQAGSPTSVYVNAQGRYVRVQLVGTNYLSLAEVVVWKQL
jgi:hypothetical protein